jgi:iron(III) transport system substrate-binding protein
MNDFLLPKWSRKCTMARPETGTTLTHAAALFDVLGAEKAKAWLEGANRNEILWVQSNGQTMKRTSSGAVAFGWTDTDDYNHAVEAEAPVAIVYPDQGEGQLGTMVIPNTVCILKDAPHLEAAKRLVDYLLSKDVEKALAFGRSRQIPVRPDVEHPPETKVPGKDFRAMEVDWESVGTNLEKRLTEVRKILGLE